MRWLVLAAMLSLAVGCKAEAADVQKAKLTCYMAERPDAVCSTGCKPRRGIVAGKKEWEGKCIAIYKRDNDTDQLGEFITLGEVLDTGVGKNGAIRKGYVIDLYCESEDDLIPTQDVWIQLIDAKG